MLQNNPLAIVSSILGVFLALHIGVSWVENKYAIGVKSIKIHFQNKKIKTLEKSLLDCYNLTNEKSLEEQKKQCLLKAKGKRRKIKKCEKKYGSI